MHYIASEGNLFFVRVKASIGGGFWCKELIENDGKPVEAREVIYACGRTSPKDFFHAQADTEVHVVKIP